MSIIKCIKTERRCQVIYLPKMFRIDEKLEFKSDNSTNMTNNTARTSRNQKELACPGNSKFQNRWCQPMVPVKFFPPQGFICPNLHFSQEIYCDAKSTHACYLSCFSRAFFSSLLNSSFTGKPDFSASSSSRCDCWNSFR